MWLLEAMTADCHGLISIYPQSPTRHYGNWLNIMYPSFQQASTLTVFCFINSILCLSLVFLFLQSSQESHPFCLLSSPLSSVCLSKWWWHHYCLPWNGLQVCIIENGLLHASVCMCVTGIIMWLLFQWPASESSDCSCEGATRSWGHQELGCTGLCISPNAALDLLIRIRSYNQTLHTLTLTLSCMNRNNWWWHLYWEMYALPHR